MALDISFDLNRAETANSTPRTASFADAERRFMDIASEIGLDLRDIHFGVTQDIVRVATNDDRAGKRSGWYVIHEEQGLLYGALGNWRSDHTYVKFTGRDERSIDSDLMRQIREKQEARRREAAEIQRKKAAEAAELVKWLKPASAEHPYLLRKQIGPNGALAMGSAILLPISDLAGNVISAQEIDIDGGKDFRQGCTTKGVYVLGGPTPCYVICEGFATGASIYEATGMRVYVTFNAGNMAAMANAIADHEGKNGGARAVIAGDNDKPNSMGETIGQKKAQQAADAIGGALVLIPEEEGADWNDIAIRKPAALKSAFSRVRPLFQGWEEIDLSLLPRRDWLYGNHYIRKFCSLTIAPGGLGKSTLALTEVISMATGRNLLGVQPKQKLRVVYHNAEDPLDEIKARVGAICQAFKIPQKELVGQLFIQSGRDSDINLAKGQQGEIIETAFQMISGFLHFYGVDLIVLDPLANMHSSPESNELMAALGKRLSRLADERNCSIEIVHHTRKLNERTSHATVDDARGGSALIGAVRAARVLNAMEADEAIKFGLKTHMDHFRIEPGGKNNLSRPSDKAIWFERSAVPMPNGDYVAVVRSWEVPDPFEGITPELVRKVQQAFQSSTVAQRESVQSADWAGHMVAYALGVDAGVPAEKAKIRNLIKTWVTSDVLRIERVMDKRQGRETPAIVCGDNRM